MTANFSHHFARRLVRPVCCALLVAGLASAAPAADRVKTRQGSQLSGDVVKTTPTSVTLKIGATNREIPANEIESIQFEGEPNGLTQARNAINARKYTEALGLLAKIPPADLKRPLVAKDAEFHAALASARAALTGSGSISEAGKKMLAFEKGNRDSFHYFEACELLGELLLALGNYPVAESYYAKLAEAPWPNYQTRASVLLGRALVGQKKYAEAIARFDQALASEASDPESQAQKVAAQLGKASALGAAGKVEEAVPLIEEILAKARPDDEEMFARAYVILGNCHLTAGRPKDAILAFLHVDLLYPSIAPLHAEALAHLAELFAAENQVERTAQARATLAQRYPDSTWTKK